MCCFWQLNSNLVFRCNGQNSMSLMFSCQKELARFSASPAPGASEYRPGDENVSQPIGKSLPECTVFLIFYDLWYLSHQRELQWFPFFMPNAFVKLQKSV